MNKDVMFSSKTDEWETPQYFFDDINKEFYFDFDACASAENAKCKRYCTKEQDGLVQKWGGCGFGATLRMVERSENG